MRTKSKFITFLLSFIPGLSHFYLGYPEKGIIYLFLFGAVTVGSIVLGLATHSTLFLITLLAGAAFIWLIALIDGFSTLSHMRYYKDAKIEEDSNSAEVQVMNQKIVALSLSAIPGAGHMYLGYQRKGLIFMATFFLSIFFMGWLNLSFMLFLLPLLWFYSFFDAFHIVNEHKVEDVDLFNLLPEIKHKHVGIGLIGIGLFIILQKILYPIIAIYVTYQMRNYIQTSIVALIFIMGGIKILATKREVIEEGEEDEEN